MRVNSKHLLVGDRVVHQILPEAATQQKITPWSIILHSNAGPRETSWVNLLSFWRRLDIPEEAHIQIALDGTIIQAMPFNVRADCNYKANSFIAFGGVAGAISIETADRGAASLPTTVWNGPQFDAITDVVAALGHKYGIPYTTPAAWNDRGVGYHSQYPEWSKYVGKTCPGASRIRQMDYVRAIAATKCACPVD